MARLRQLVVVAVSISTVLCACGASDTDERGVDGVSSSCGRFHILDGGDWEFRQAVDYPEDLGSLAEVEPSLDWVSEFERFVLIDDQTVEGISLRISGHRVGLEDFQSELVAIALQERDDISGETVFVGSGPEGEPSIVARPVDNDYTVMLLSYGLDTNELIQVAAAIRPACQEEWLDAGGQVLDCMPTDPDCIAEP